MMNRNIHRNDLLVKLMSKERSKRILDHSLSIDTKKKISNRSKLIQVNEEHDQRNEILVYNRVITNDKQKKEKFDV